MNRVPLLVAYIRTERYGDMTFFGTLHGTCPKYYGNIVGYFFVGG